MVAMKVPNNCLLEQESDKMIFWGINLLTMVMGRDSKDLRKTGENPRERQISEDTEIVLNQ